MMKVISIKQPWAWLIVNRYKPLENRTWNTNYRGELGIQASLGFDKEGYEFVHSLFQHIAMPSPHEFQRGGIVGMANLLHCIPPAESHLLTQLDARWYNPGCHAWILGDAETLPFMPCKGKLGFFNVDYPTRAA